jgi:hypothetical protein
MADSFEFTTAAGKLFKLSGPPGFSLSQAQAIFDQQESAGSLVGIKPGQILSAATQAAGGLSSAAAQLGQSLSGVTGALGAGIPGAAGLIGGAVPGGLTSAAAAVNQLTGSAGSIAASAVGTISKAMGSLPVTNGIDVANFAKAETALGSIGSMTTSQVTGVLAQAKNLVGQASDVMTNAKGVGSFGFDAKQLETAGILKPGVSNLIESGASTLTSALKSPLAFTGKDGIKGVGDLLGSSSAQSKIQQGLMSSGVAALGAAGIPTDALNAQGLAGMALNAAKSIPGAEALAKGLPLPGDATGALKAAMETNIRDGAFAVNLTDALPGAFKETVKALPSLGTVDRSTLNAAADRILGSAKIPKPSFGPPESVVNAFAAINPAGLKDAASNLPAAGDLLKKVTGAAGGLTGALSGAAGGLTGALSGATGALTGALSGAAGGLTGALSGASGALSSVSGLANKAAGVLGGANPLKALDGALASATSAASAASSVLSKLTGSLPRV